jgi:hypothetical protein
VTPTCPSESHALQLVHGTRHQEDLQVTAGHARRASARRDADLRHSKITVTMEIYTEAPSDATQDTLGKLSDWRVNRCCRLMLPQDEKRPVPWSEPAGELGGRYWDRTSDLLGVN